MSKVTPLSESEQKQILENLDSWVQQDPETRNNSVIAKGTGCSISTINLLRNGKYPAKDPSSPLRKIRNFLLMQKGSVIRYSDEPVFVMTSAAKEIFITLKYASAYKKLVLVTGQPGGGKTMALKEYCRLNGNAVRIEADPLMTNIEFLNKLGSQLKIKFDDRERATTYRTFARIIETLSGSDRPLILDEAENLKLKQLEIARKILDFAKIPMVIAGKEILESRLIGGRKNDLLQLSSRVSMKSKIPPLEEEDTRLIIEANFPEAIHYTDYIHTLIKGNGRHLDSLMNIVRFLTEELKKDVDEDIIDLAAERLLMSER